MRRRPGVGHIDPAPAPSTLLVGPTLQCAWPNSSKEKVRKKSSAGPCQPVLPPPCPESAAAMARKNPRHARRCWPLSAYPFPGSAVGTTRQHEITQKCPTGHPYAFQSVAGDPSLTLFPTWGPGTADICFVAGSGAIGWASSAGALFGGDQATAARDRAVKWHRRFFLDGGPPHRPFGACRPGAPGHRERLFMEATVSLT